MSDFQFVLNIAGVGELLKSAEMAAVIGEYAEREAAETGGEAHVFVGFDRVHGIVKGGTAADG